MNRKVFNSEILEAWKEIDPVAWKTLVSEIIQIFLDTVPLQYQELIQACSRQDWATAKRLSHSMKSSYGNVGAELGHSLLDQIEKSTQGDETKIAGLMGQLNPIYQQTLTELGRFKLQLQAA